MVLLSSIQSLFQGNESSMFEKGHPVQLLLYLFNQFNQESVILLLSQLDKLMPEIPNESKQLVEKAQSAFSAEYQTHLALQEANDEEKEYIEAEIKKKQHDMKKRKKNKQKQEDIKLDSDEDENEDDDDDDEDDNDDNDDKDNKDNKKNDELWLNKEKYQFCDLSYRKATKLSPKSIKVYIAYIKFLFQCKKFEAAKKMYEKLIKIVHDLKKSKTSSTNSSSSSLSKGTFGGHQINNRTKGRFNKKSKKSSSSKQKSIAMEQKLTLSQLTTIESLIIFYMGYLYYLEDMLNEYNESLRTILDLEPNHIGFRCQYVLSLCTGSEKYEEAYIYIIETLKLLNKEEMQERMAKEMISHYRVILGIGCASIRTIYATDWDMVGQHLEYVIQNDDNKIGILNYIYSYSLYRCGKIEASNQYYDKFVEYIKKRKSDAEKKKESKKQKNKQEIDEKDDDELDMINDAASKLNMDFFKWHPDHINKQKNPPKSKISEIAEHAIDIAVVLSIFLVIHIISGYKPNLGNNIYEWFTIIVALLISLSLLPPPLAILLIAVSLPPISEDNTEFNYIGFFSKWGCVSMGLFVIYKTMIGGSIPGSRFF